MSVRFLLVFLISLALYGCDGDDITEDKTNLINELNGSWYSSTCFQYRGQTHKYYLNISMDGTIMAGENIEGNIGNWIECDEIPNSIDEDDMRHGELSLIDKLTLASGLEAYSTRVNWQPPAHGNGYSQYEPETTYGLLYKKEDTLYASVFYHTCCPTMPEEIDFDIAYIKTD